jgi:hypothetical protein
MQRISFLLFAMSMALAKGASAADDAKEKWFCKGEACADILPLDGDMCQFLMGEGECRTQAKAVVLSGFFVLDDGYRYFVFSNSATCQHNLARWSRSVDVKRPRCQIMTPKEFDDYLRRYAKKPQKK